MIAASRHLANTLGRSSPIIFAGPARFREPLPNTYVSNSLFVTINFYDSKSIRGKLASGFENLRSECVGHVGFVARFRHIRRAKQLLLAVMQHVADSLLHFGIGNLALAGSFLGGQFQNAIAAAFHREAAG